MVAGLVSAEVARIETKVEGLEANMDTGFVDVNKKFDDVNLALERIEKAIAVPPASSAPLPQGGTVQVQTARLVDSLIQVLLLLHRLCNNQLQTMSLPRPLTARLIPRSYLLTAMGGRKFPKLISNMLLMV